MPPSDEQMIAHFIQHEAAFEEIREIIFRCPYGMYYPPYDKQQDTLCLKGISDEDQRRLDSLLMEIGSERIFYIGKKLKKAMCEKSGENSWDTTCTSFTISYYVHGYSIGGTSKDFLYNPELKNKVTVSITENGELNEIYSRNFCDTILYKLIKNHWYIN